MKTQSVIAAADKLAKLAERIRQTADAQTPREKQARTRAINAAAQHVRRLFEANLKSTTN